MGAHAVIKHALIQGLESVPCAQCAGFGETRPATHTARYLPASQEGAAGDTEALCAPCASNRRVYCDVRPLPTGAPSRGVSLVKRGALSPGATRTVRVPEFVLASRRGADVDRAVAMGPIGMGPMLACNDLRALSVAFDVMVQLNH